MILSDENCESLNIHRKHMISVAQFTYNRGDRNVVLSNFMDEEGGIPEEDEDQDEAAFHHSNSQECIRPQMNDIDEGIRYIFFCHEIKQFYVYVI